MKITERDLSFAIWAVRAHDCVERRERNAHVARMRGNALFALAENGVNSIVTIECPAATTGFAFVTRWKGWIVKIKAPRPLHQIPTDRCHVAQLRTCARKECLAQNRITRFD
jgi:hypothetical protein